MANTETSGSPDNSLYPRSRRDNPLLRSTSRRRFEPSSPKNRSSAHVKVDSSRSEHLSQQAAIPMQQPEFSNRQATQGHSAQYLQVHSIKAPSSPRSTQSPQRLRDFWNNKVIEQRLGPAAPFQTPVGIPTEQRKSETPRKVETLRDSNQLEKSGSDIRIIDVNELKEKEKSTAVCTSHLSMKDFKPREKTLAEENRNLRASVELLKAELNKEKKERGEDKEVARREAEKTKEKLQALELMIEEVKGNRRELAEKLAKRKCEKDRERKDRQEKEKSGKEQQDLEEKLEHENERRIQEEDKVRAFESERLQALPPEREKELDQEVGKKDQELIERLEAVETETSRSRNEWEGEKARLQDIARLETDLKKGRSSADEKSDWVTERLSLLETISRLETELEKEKKEEKKLREAKNYWEGERSCFIETLSKLETELEKEREEKKKMSEEKADLENKKAYLASALSNLETELEKTREVKNGRVAEINEYKGEKTRLLETILRLETELEKEKGEKKKYSEEKTELEGERNHLLETISRKASEEKEFEKSCEEERARLLSIITSLEEKQKELKNEEEEFEKSWEEENARLQTTISELDGKQKELEREDKKDEWEKAWELEKGKLLTTIAQFEENRREAERREIKRGKKVLTCCDTNSPRTNYDNDNPEIRRNWYRRS